MIVLSINTSVSTPVLTSGSPSTISQESSAQILLFTWSQVVTARDEPPLIGICTVVKLVAWLLYFYSDLCGCVTLCLIHIPADNIRLMDWCWSAMAIIRWDCIPTIGWLLISRDVKC